MLTTSSIGERGQNFLSDSSGASRLPAIVTLAALISISIGCKSGYPVAARQNSNGGDADVRQVNTTRVVEMPMERAVTVTGTLAAYDQASLSLKVTGRLRAITVDLGSVVGKGQMIAQVEPQDYQLRLQQSEAALAQARARLGLSAEGGDDRVDPEQTATVKQARAVLDEARTKRERSASLLKQGIISQAEFDTADSAYNVAQSRHQDAIEEIRNRQAVLAQRRSEVALARQQLSDTTIYAPFDGVIQEKRASIGEFLAAGAAVATIVRMNPLRLRAEVPERYARSVRTGQQVRVTVEGDSNIYTGTIKRLSPTIAEQNRMLIVEAEVLNSGFLRPGSFARVEIVTDDSSLAAVVPAKSLVSFAGIERVFIVEDGKAVERPITTGRRTGDWTEVVTGVSVGDVVIIEPGNIQSGQPVNVAE